MTEAYEVLTDKQKRQQYDQYGDASSGPNGFGGPGGPAGGFGGAYPGQGGAGDFSDFFQQSGKGGFTFHSTGFPNFASSGGGFTGSPGGAGGFGDIFQDLMGGMFGQGGGMGGMGGQQHFTSASGNPFQQQQKQQQPRGQSSGRNQQQRASTPKKKPLEPLKHTVECTLEELYRGHVKKLKVKDTILDESTGRKKVIEKVFPVRITAGAASGTQVTFTPEENEGSDAFPRTVIFEIKELPHPQYRREGADLIWTCRLSHRQIEKGVMIQVPLMDGSALALESKDYDIKSGLRVPFPGHGMPSGSKRGKLIVQFEIKT